MRDKDLSQNIIRKYQLQSRVSTLISGINSAKTIVKVPAY